MAKSVITTLWAKITGKGKGTTHSVDLSTTAAHTSVLYDREGKAMVLCGVASGQGKSKLDGSMPAGITEYAMTSTGGAVPVIDLFGERAESEAKVRAVSLTDHTCLSESQVATPRPEFYLPENEATLLTLGMGEGRHKLRLLVDGQQKWVSLSYRDVKSMFRGQEMMEKLRQRRGE